MRTALVIAAKDLRQRVRDRSAMIIAFVAPLVLALIIAGAFGGGFADFFEATYAVVDEDGSELSKGFTEGVLSAPQLREQIKIERASSEAQARQLIGRDRVSAAFVIPAGFSESVLASRRASIRVLQNPDAEIGSQVAEAIAQAYTDQISAARLSVLTAARAGAAADPARLAELGRAAAAERLPVQVVDGRIGVREVNGASYFGPAMAIFFLFFTTGFAARSLLAEREQGTLPRVLSAPVRPSAVIIGKALTGLVVGSASLAVMFALFALLLDVNWGDPLTLVVLSVATVIAVMALTAVVQSLARTQQQADAYSSVVAVFLALLGGSFFPLFQMPEAMQRVSVFTPNAWAIRGFTDIVYDGATLPDLVPNLLVITGFAVVTGGVALWRVARLGIR